MLRWTALALTALTGFSGLVYEVTWQKYVATLLGSHSEATAAVLGLFLGGLSVGYAVFGAATRRVVLRAAERGKPPRLLLMYGCVEAAIGLHALAFPALFSGVRWLSWTIPHDVSGLGFALDVSLVSLLVVPPTILMGGTIPILTQALSRSLQDATRLHALVYACNTAGAFFGALAAGFVLVPRFGLFAVVIAMGSVNLVAGAAFCGLGFLRRGALGIDESEETVRIRLGILAPVALLVGFAAMTLQTVFIRIAGLAIGSSEFTFSVVVAVFVLCIAVGSFVVSALTSIPRGLLVVVQVSLAGLLILLQPAIGDATYWAHLLRSAFRDEPSGFYLYYFAVFVAVLGVLAVPVGLSGATLPLMFHQLRRRFGGLGSAAGRLYAWNTVGSLLGALLGGYVLLFWLDLDQVYSLAVGAICVSAGLLVVRWRGWGGVMAAGVVPLLGLPLLLPRWEPVRLAAGLYRLREPIAITGVGPDRAFAALWPVSPVVFYTDDPAASVAVLESTGSRERADSVAIVSNGKPDGTIPGDYPTMALAGLLAALFADSAERAFVIGFGTGVTAGELAALDSMKEVVVAEISPGVIEAGAFFESRNQGALSSPKTRVIVSDAYRALQASGERFDVIVSEPSNPWVTGVEMLFSREFLDVARDHLAPGGVYAQWFHLYEVDDEVVSLVLRTYASVFDHVAVWYTLGSDVILLGFEDDRSALDLERLEGRAARPDFESGIRRSGIDSLAALLAHEILPVGVTHAAGLEGDVHTLLHPVLSHRAARAFFMGRSGSLPRAANAEAVEVGARNSLLARLRWREGGSLSEDALQAAASEVCRTGPEPCAVVLSHWEREHPGSARRDAFLERQRARWKGSEHLAPESMIDLELLHGARPLIARRLPLSDVQRLTALYESHYRHGFAFDRGVLAEVWGRCKDARSGVACSEARLLAEKRLGPLRGDPDASRP